MLVVLADGMGGHAAGDVASQTAVEHFSHNFSCNPAKSVAARLGSALQAAGEGLREAIQLVPEFADMGCTLLAVHIQADGIQWISVGDSPLFLIRDGEISQINEDHSMGSVLDKLVLAGQLTSREAASDPERQALTSVLSSAPMPAAIDCPDERMRLCAGDAIIVASDGIRTLALDEIVASLSATTTASQVCEYLAQKIASKDKVDQDNTNIHVILIKSL